MFSYLAIYALVHTRLTPFVIFHALVMIFFLCFASDIGGLYPIMGEFDPNAMRSSARMTSIYMQIQTTHYHFRSWGAQRIEPDMGL